MSRKLVAIGLALVCAGLVFGFVRLRNPSGNKIFWPTFPIDFAVNQRGTHEIADDSEFTAITNSVNTWAAVPDTTIQFNQLARTTMDGLAEDGLSVISWVDNPASSDAVPGFAAVTTLHLDEAGDPRHILESDTVLNGVHFSWTTNGDGNFTSQNGPLDVQAVVTHELGHFLGFAHTWDPQSAVYPLSYGGSIRARNLSQEEVSAVQAVYPSAGAPADSTISGNVSRGAPPVPGAYVVAYQDGVPVVGALTDANGDYTINRVPPGDYQVRVQPYSWFLNMDPFFSTITNVDGDFMSAFYINVSPFRTYEEANAFTVTVNAGAGVSGINFKVIRPICGNDPFDFEPNDTLATAKPITLATPTADNTSQLHHSCALNDEDWISFSAVAGRLYVIETKLLGKPTVVDANVDTRLELYDASMTRLDVDMSIPPDLDKYVESDNRNRREEDYSSRIAWLETTNATRYILARQVDGGLFREGVYFSVLVTELAAPGTPVVTGVTPASASEDGDIIVTVEGTGFTPGAQVTFGGDDGTEESVQDCVSLTDCRAIKVHVPPHSPGTVDVAVTNRGGGSHVLPNGFTFIGNQAGTFDENEYPFSQFIGDGSLLCWGDMDDDGDPDLFNPYQDIFSNTGELWRNDGGTFVDVTVSSLLDGMFLTCNSSCSWTDFDKDGDLDLYISQACIGGINELWRNDGDIDMDNVTEFFEVAATFGVQGSLGCTSTDGGWEDFDQDGDLDLFVTCTDGATTNQLYENKGAMPFVNVAATAGLAHAGASNRAIWGDYDQDGFPDLFVANFSGEDDILYHNNGNQTFTNVTVAAGITADANCSDPEWGDLSGDGLLDLFCAGNTVGTGHPPQLLWINNGDGTFAQIAAAAGVDDLDRNGLAVTYLDKDNDGDLDIFIGCSQTLPPFANADLDVLLENNGLSPPVFTDVSGPLSMGFSGMDETAPRNAFTAASADYDRDGDVDVFATGSTGLSDDLYAWRNTSNTNDYLAVQLRGDLDAFTPMSNPLGLGAIVSTIREYPGNDQPSEDQCLSPPVGAIVERRTMLGNSLNQSPMEVWFGLGPSLPNSLPNALTQDVDCVIVDWPSGLRRAYPRVGANQVFRIVEGDLAINVASITPSSGTTAGGDTITITGYRMGAVADVFFGAVMAAMVNVIDDNTLQVVTPPHAAGTVDVLVSNSSGTSQHTVVDGFSFIAPGTAITLMLVKNSAIDAVEATWTDIGQLRYQFHRASGSPLQSSFEVGFGTSVVNAQYTDTGVLTDGIDYFYLVPGGVCGNNMLDPAEDCEESNHNGQTCMTLGFASGMLTCSTICAFDVSNCSL